MSPGAGLLFSKPLGAGDMNAALRAGRMLAGGDGVSAIAASAKASEAVRPVI
jgi:hypothetical protein